MERVDGHTGPDGTYEYDYDLNGNRNWSRRNGQQTNYSLNATTKRLDALTGVNPETRGYDANGNTTSITAGGSTRHFDHNDLNRFWRYREGSQTVTYKHNAFGERQVKVNGSTTTRFMYDGPALMYESKPGQTRSYIYLEGQMVGMVHNNTLLFVHTDHLGRPEIVTDAARTVDWSSRSDAFGNTPAVNLIGGFNVGFPGQYYDIESGMYYNYFRTYDSTTGRYLQSDPIGLAGGLNTYGYAGGNPVNWIDPLGLERARIMQDQDIDELLRGVITREEYRERINSRGIGAACAAVVVVLGVGGTAKEVGQTVFEEVTGIPLGIPKISDIFRRGSRDAAVPNTVLRGFGHSEDDLSRAASQPINSTGLTRAARALDKHAAGQRSTGTFPRLSGNVAERNRRAQEIVDDILTNPKSSFERLGRGGLEVRSPNGRGLRFEKDGSFSGFVD